MLRSWAVIAALVDPPELICSADAHPIVKAATIGDVTLEMYKAAPVGPRVVATMMLDVNLPLYSSALSVSALTNVAKELAWCKRLLKERGFAVARSAQSVNSLRVGTLFPAVPGLIPVARNRSLAGTGSAIPESSSRRPK